MRNPIREELEFYLLGVTYEVIGGEPHIIMYSITRDGRRVVIIDRSFRPYFYVILRENTDPSQVALKVKTLSEAGSPIMRVDVVDKRYYGRLVKALKVTTAIPESVRKYRRRIRELGFVRDVVEADIRFSMRCILDKELRPCGWHTARVREIPSTKPFRVNNEYEEVGDVKSLEDSRPPRDLRVMFSM
ncbi:MAG: hypothetical protein ACO2OS_03605 [Thermosphaera aggregans]|uniref:hypothetical protein n=1 Tax=Thermosphaera aggregans TaxID=54254 RepID=UPI003BFD07CD